MGRHGRNEVMVVDLQIVKKLELQHKHLDASSHLSSNYHKLITSPPPPQPCWARASSEGKGWGCCKVEDGLLWRHSGRPCPDDMCQGPDLLVNAVLGHRLACILRLFPVPQQITFGANPPHMRTQMHALKKTCSCKAQREHKPTQMTAAWNAWPTISTHFTLNTARILRLPHTSPPPNFACSHHHTESTITLRAPSHSEHQNFQWAAWALG